VTAADAPFPGARSQVRGQRQEDAPPEPRESVGERLLPLESSYAPAERGWSVRLPVRAEQISVAKQTVVYERVVVRRREIADEAHLQADVRREELRIAEEGDPRLSTPERAARQGS
jgi:uncharacterized protein (TIGR02271 family)